MKVIDRLDCSGSGDVDTSVTVQALAGGTVIGVSGRTLTVRRGGGGLSYIHGE